MLKKINATYNRKNISNRGAANSIESYIREEMIRSSEDGKEGFFAKIKAFFKKIIDFIVGLIKSIILGIKNFFRKLSGRSPDSGITPTSISAEDQKIIRYAFLLCELYNREYFLSDEEKNEIEKWLGLGKNVSINAQNVSNIFIKYKSKTINEKTAKEETEHLRKNIEALKKMGIPHIQNFPKQINYYFLNIPDYVNTLSDFVNEFTNYTVKSELIISDGLSAFNDAVIKNLKHGKLFEKLYDGVYHAESLKDPSLSMLKKYQETLSVLFDTKIKFDPMFQNKGWTIDDYLIDDNSISDISSKIQKFYNAAKKIEVTFMQQEQKIYDYMDLLEDKVIDSYKDNSNKSDMDSSLKHIYHFFNFIEQLFKFISRSLRNMLSVSSIYCTYLGINKSANGFNNNVEKNFKYKIG
jgi:hypothetical protein